MAVGRMLNKTSALDRELNSVSIEAQLLFVMSIPHLDRDGLIIGEPLPHLGTVLPLRPDFFSKYEQLIGELTDPDKGLIVAYETKKGRVLFFPGFRKNQTFAYSREAASVFDPPPEYVRTDNGLAKEDGSEGQVTSDELIATNSGVDQDLLATNSGNSPDQNTLKLSKDKLSKGKSGVAHATKKDQQEPTEQQEMFGAVAEVCKVNPQLKASMIGKTATALLKAGYTPKQVLRFPAWWKSDWHGKSGSVATMGQLLEFIEQAVGLGENATPKNGTDPVKPKMVKIKDLVTEEIKEVPVYE